MNHKRHRGKTAFIIYTVFILLLYTLLVMGRNIYRTRHQFVPFNSIYNMLAFATPVYIMFVIRVFFRYIPFGFFFRRVSNKPRSMAFPILVSTAATSTICAISMMIFWGHDWYYFNIDDVIATAMGSAAGCAIDNLICSVKVKSLSESEQSSTRCPTAASVKASVVYLSGVVALFLCLGVGNTLAPQGLVRRSLIRIPNEVVIQAEIMTESMIGRAYKADKLDIDGVAKVFRRLYPDATIEGNRNNGYELSGENITARIYKDGDWRCKMQMGSSDFSMEWAGEKFEQLANALIFDFIRTDEKAVCMSNELEYAGIWDSSIGESKEDKTRPYRALVFQLQNDRPQDVIYKDNKIWVVFHSDGAVSINYYPRRTHATAEVTLISAEEALEFGKRIAIQGFERKVKDIKLTSAESTYIYIYGKEILIPGYHVAGTYVDRNGDLQEWDTEIDTVDRGNIFLWAIVASILLTLFLSVLFIKWLDRHQLLINKTLDLTKEKA